MSRLQAFAVVAAFVAAAAASATAGGSPAAPQRPDPLLTNLSLDYGAPLPAAGGGTATLAPLAGALTPAALADLSFLRYRTLDDWGGFAIPPLGGSALETGGSVSSHVFRPGAAPSGKSPKPAPTPSPTPRVPQPPLPSSSPVPCANGGFGGTACTSTHAQAPKPRPHHHRRKRRHKRRHMRLYRCGTRGLSILSDLPHCRIAVANGVHGYGQVEHFQIKNTTRRRYRLSFEAKGSSTPLWDFLELGVWRTRAGAPTPLPLRFWTQRFTRLLTLKPGRTVRITIELYLPASAGNAVQHQSASIAFVWRAVS